MSKNWKGEKCEYCGEPYRMIFHLPDWLWKQIQSKSEGCNLLCPHCVEMFSRRLGYTLYWEASVGGFPSQTKEAK